MASRTGLMPAASRGFSMAQRGSVPKKIVAGTQAKVLEKKANHLSLMTARRQDKNGGASRGLVGAAGPGPSVRQDKSSRATQGRVGAVGPVQNGRLGTEAQRKFKAREVSPLSKPDYLLSCC